MKRIACIGVGFMGSATARAVRAAQPAVELGIVDRYAERRSALLADVHGRDFGEDAAGACSWADTAILAIKPQDLSRLGRVCTTDAIVISILAGTPISTVGDVSGSDRVARLMPNLAAEIGEATVGLALPDNADDELCETARTVATALGTVLEVPERLMPAITALSGSGIAFVFRFVNAMAMAAVREGLPYPQALEGAINVVASGAHLLGHFGTNPEEMVARVCSPAGTTVAGVSALEENGFSHAVNEAVAAAARRARELDT